MMEQNLVEFRSDEKKQKLDGPTKSEANFSHRPG